MSLLNFRRAKAGTPGGGIASLARDISIEVMPRTAAKVEDFPALLPPGTRVYIAHIDGTPIEDMVATAARLAANLAEDLERADGGYPGTVKTGDRRR
mgnify:CR=1 FL=1